MTIVEILDECDVHRDYYQYLVTHATSRACLIELEALDIYTDTLTEEQIVEELKAKVDGEVDSWCQHQIHDFLRDHGYSVERLRELNPDHHLLCHTDGDLLVLDPRRCSVTIGYYSHYDDLNSEINVSHPTVDALVAAIDQLEWE